MDAPGQRRPDEQPFLAAGVRQVRDAGLDGPVQMPDGGEVLAARDDVAPGHGGRGAAERGRAVGVLEVHPLGAFEEHEVAQGRLPERDKRQVHAGRVGARGLGKVRPGQVRGRAHGGQHVLHQGQVQHLLGGHVGDRGAPALDGLVLLGGEPLLLRLLQAEGGVQVLAHDAVLELGRLAQHVDQRLAMLDHERGLGRSQAASAGDHLREPPARGLDRGLVRGLARGGGYLVAVGQGAAAAGDT